MIEASDYSDDGIITFPSLISGYTEAVHLTHSSDLLVSITMLGSPDDSVMVEGSIDNIYWGNMNISNTSTSFIVAGTKLFNWDRKIPPYVRVRKVSGTTPTIVKFFVGAVS